MAPVSRRPQFRSQPEATNSRLSHDDDDRPAFEPPGGLSDTEAVVITGAHAIIYSVKPELDRAFIRDVLGLPSVDTGGGWLIFGLPPSEVAVHPADKNDEHEFYLMCDDVNAFIAV